MRSLGTTTGSGSTSGAASGGASGAAGGSSGAAVMPTWTSLYAAYFGNPTTGGCGSTIMICHQAKTDTGVVTNPPNSGFVCGTTAADCYLGMMNANPQMIGPNFMGAKATTAPLYLSLYKGGRSGGITSDNMPQSLGYCFSATPGACPAGCPTPCGDLTAIQAWIAAGSPNN